jgi:ubiquinone/menaquinone biosynthesis C-methylase UbiE
MTQQHNSLVQSQFGPRANAYIASAAHAQGADLQRIFAIAATNAPIHALDLGCGGGHVAYAMGPHAARVTACDLSAEMIAAVEAEAERRSLSSIQTCCAPAASLPFADGTFDMLACRKLDDWKYPR